MATRLLRHISFVTITTLLALAQVSIGEARAGAEDRTTDYYIAGLDFRTSEFVEASRFGVTGGGKTDNTNIFRALLGTGNRTIHIRPGTYLTGKLVIPRHTVLLLDSGVIIKDSGKLGPDDRLVTIRSEYVYIQGKGAKIVADRKSYSSGEQRHGVFIYGATNVVIDGLESIGHSGDGYYIGGPPYKPAENIILEDCLASRNRRQGLSITSARQVQVINCRFDHTQGTPPQYGIDLEPNSPVDVLSGIRIIGPHTVANEGGGILISVTQLTRSSKPLDIDIVGHVSVHERRPYTPHGVDRVRGTVKYTAAARF